MTALTDIETALSSRSASDAIQAELEKGYSKVNEVAELGLALVQQSTVLPRHLETLCSRDVEGVCKSSALVQQNKAKGALAFKRSRYLEAACAYSESLRHIGTGPTEVDKLAATLLANRALCLLKAQPQEAERALVDCEQALQLDSSNAKAKYRHIQSLAALGRHAEALQSVQESLEQTSLAAIHREEITQLSDRLQLAEQSHYTPNRECQGIAVGTRDPAPAVVSPALRLRTSQTEGSHYVAAEDIPPAKQLIMETPYAAVLTSLHSKMHCWGCLEEIQPYAPFSCPGCAAALFCSPTCQAANDLHQPGSPLCGRPWPLLLPTDGVLAACVAAKAQRTPNEAVEVARLETHFSHMGLDNLRPLIALACLATACWNVSAQEGTAHGQPQASFGSLQGTWQGNQQLLSAGAVLQALLQIRINGIAVVPSQHASVKDRIALAIYTQASMLNHACLPNTALSFKGRQLVLHASTPISEGEAVLTCYGPQVGEMVTCQRRQVLERQYHFTCNCRWCSYPSDAELRMVGVKCPGCAGPVWTKRGPRAGLLSLHAFPAVGSGTCSSCHRRLTEAEEHHAMEQLTTADKAFEAAVNLLDGVSHSSEEAWKRAAASASQLLEHCVQIQTQILCKGNQRLGQSHDALGRLLVELGDFDGAKPHMIAAFDAVAAAYPPGSPVVAHQHSALMQLYPDATT